MLAATLREGFAPLGSLGALLGSEAPFSGLGAAFLVLTLSCTPYVQLVVSAALMRLPAHAEEAAQTLGAPPSKVFWQVVFPALRPALGFAALLVVVYAAADFGAVAVMDVPDEKEEQSSIADLQAKLAEQERIGANSMKKQKELRSAMANLLGMR